MKSMIISRHIFYRLEVAFCVQIISHFVTRVNQILWSEIVSYPNEDEPTILIFVELANDAFHKISFTPGIFLIHFDPTLSNVFHNISCVWTGIL